jgi:hypothetical protein
MIVATAPIKGTRGTNNWRVSIDISVEKKGMKDITKKGK